MTKKSYNKFVATAATATLVASAIAPVAASADSKQFTDVNERYAPAVDYVVSKGVQGKTSTQFGVQDSIKRVDAAVFIANALDLNKPGSPDAGFSDVPARAKDAVNALKEKGIINGKTDTRYGANDVLTRGEVALILASAYNLKGDADSVKFTDVNKNRYGAAVAGLVDAGVTNGISETKFGTENPVKRGDLAVFLYGLSDETGVPGEVTSVKATNQTTLTLTGAGLKDLKEEDIKVENNSVKSISVSADGKTATVVLNSELVIDEKTKVTVKEKEFTVTYSIDAKKIAVVEATYDDDTKDQYVAVTVDGKTLNAQELINAGYTVKFEAFKTKAAKDEVTDELFANDETGKLSDTLDQDPFLTAMGETALPTDGLDVFVKVTATKGTEVITSDIAKLKIQNIDLAANSITDFVLTNYGADKTAGGTVADQDFEQNSSTLVAGEVAAVTEITVKAGSEKEDIKSGYTLESSNKAVFTVDGNKITAQGPGTATLTIKYGGVTKTQTITVKNDKREMSKVELAKPNLKVGKDQFADSKIYLYDQYGDPMNSDVKIKVSDEEILEVSADGSAKADYDNFKIGNDADNETKIYVKGLKKGSATVTFRDSADVKIGTATLKVEVSENTDLNKFELKVDNDISDSDVEKVNTATGATLTKDDISESLEIDLGKNGEKYVKIDLKAFNAQGFELKGDHTNEDQYKVKVNQSRAGVIGNNGEAHTADGFIVVEAGKLTGSATIEVTSTEDSKVKATVKVNVVDKGYNVTGITFKDFAKPTYAQTINYEDVLTHKEVASDKDPVLSGVKLTKETSYPVRLDVNTDKGKIYIDKNADGKYTDGERIVGELQLTSTGTFTNTITDAIDGIDVVSGDDGTLLFKVVDNAGKVVGTKAIEVDF